MSTGKQVLIADDQASIRNLVKTIVSSLGSSVIGEAENGYEAVQQYKKLQPDLVLLDINMPVMSGVEALEKILEEYPQANIAMLTSQNTMEVVKQCARLGAKYFVLKTSPDTISTELQKLL